MNKIWTLVSMLLLIPVSFANAAATTASINWRSDIPTFNHTREELTQNWSRWHREDNMPMPTAQALAERVKNNKALQQEFPEGTDFNALNDKILNTWLMLHNGNLQQAYNAAAELKQFGVIMQAHARYLNSFYSLTDKNERIAEFKSIADALGAAIDNEPEEKDLLFMHAYMHGRFLEEQPFLMKLVPTYTKLFNGVKGILKEQPKHLGAQLIQASFHADASVKAPFLSKVRFGSKPEVAKEKFAAALAQDPGSAIAQLEYATSLIKLNKGKPDDAALAALKAAAALEATDCNTALAQKKAKNLLAANGVNIANTP